MEPDKRLLEFLLRLDKAEGKERKDRIPDGYFTETGRFITGYAGLENQVRALFNHFAQMPGELGMAISGGMRLIDVMASVKRVMLARGLDQQLYDTVDRLFDRIAELSVFRDKLVHRQWRISQDGSVVLTNEGTAKSRFLVVSEAISVQEIIDRYYSISYILMDTVPLFLSARDWEKAEPELRKSFACPWFDNPTGPAVPPQQVPRSRR